MTEGLRLAALRLHGTTAADRDWILDRLGRRERRQLVALLRDLKRTGIGAAQAEAVRHEVAERPEPLRPEPLRPESAAVEIPDGLEQAGAEAVARVLRAEPEWVRSAILAAHSWKWRRAVLQRISTGDADATRAAPVAAALRPALAAALARSLTRRIAEQRDSSGTPFERVMDNLDPLTRVARPRVWDRLRRWMP